MSEPNQVIVDVPEGIKIARAAFLHDFASLSADRETSGKFVCYRRDKLVAVGKVYRAMIREVVAKGFPNDEWLIFKVVPSAGPEQQAFADEAEIYLD